MDYYDVYGLRPAKTAKKKKKKKKRKKDPKYVHDKYEEILKKQKTKDEGKAKAVAWSIYCKYKKPNSPRCKKDPDEYFQNRKAYQGKRETRQVALKIGKMLYESLVGKNGAILYIYDLIEDNASNEYVADLALYMWTRGEVPFHLLRYGKEALIVGEIAGKIHRENKPSKTPTKADRQEALKLLSQAFEYIYSSWSIDIWAKTTTLSRKVNILDLKLEILSYDNRIKFSYEYEKLLSLLFAE